MAALQKESGFWRVQVGMLPSAADPAGESACKAMREDMGLLQVKSVRVLEGFYFSKEFVSKNQAQILASQVFCDPVVQESSLEVSLESGIDCDWKIEVSYKKGVTDNIAETSKIAIQDALKTKLSPQFQVKTSKIYCIKGALSRQQVLEAVQKLLANEVIQEYSVENGR